MDTNGQKIRVALVCTSLNQLGGKNRHFRNLYKYLSRYKFEVVIFLCSRVEKELRDFMLREGVPEKDLVFLSRLKKWLVVPFIFELKKAFLTKKISIVHTFDIQSDVLGALAARYAGIKNVYALFESKVIPENTPFIKKIFYKLVNKIVKGSFVKTVVVSEGLRREVISESFRNQDSVLVIHLGFDIPDKYKDKSWSFEKLRQGKPLIGTISRLSSEKGLERFVNAMPLVLQSFPEARFTIIGKGPDAKRLKMSARQLGVASKVIFKEWTDDVFAELEEIDIFVMPSLREGCPNAIFEALSLSRPVVASDIEGIKDIIRDKEDGLLIDTSNAQDFAKSILYLCSNPGKAIELGESGFKRIVSEFTLEREVSMLKGLYLEGMRESGVLPCC